MTCIPDDLIDRRIGASNPWRVMSGTTTNERLVNLARPVRAAAQAGKYYPEEPEFLARVVDGFLKTATAPTDWPKGVIAPHSGYIYSGSVAAAALSPWWADPGMVRRVVLLGPSHHFDFPGVALPDSSAFSTPLGEIPLDTQATESLLKHRFVRVFEAAHFPEHSLEVLLPFLQRIFREFSIVPLIVGRSDATHVSQLVDELWGGADTVFIVSSDLSHNQTYELGQKIDRNTSRAIQHLEINKITADQACGFQSIRGFLKTAVRREMRCSIADLRNSADTAEVDDQVTGFGAFHFFES